MNLIIGDLVQKVSLETKFTSPYLAANDSDTRIYPIFLDWYKQMKFLSV